jgi:hypothetical protein
MTMSDTFEFALEADVSIITSGEAGTVVGRLEYLNGENSYLVRYKAADGRAVEAWWNESALEETP